jgi:hypothetical protein
MIAESRNVQVAFVSMRSGTHVFVRGTVEQTPGGIGFSVSDVIGAMGGVLNDVLP